jgi:hypothetical protein
MGQSSPRATAQIDSIATVKIIVAVDTFFLVLGELLMMNPSIALEIPVLLKLTGFQENGTINPCARAT